ncbi:MAG TPA: Rid family detoxifying hydrolase [Tepidisphaeraceae bacterium]|jgi:2-iminobutanoate/2-iminopropanoate deaminase|nr:Rid family detoxifying hydrolase [Tepidisphaeraceae bacterium]
MNAPKKEPVYPGKDTATGAYSPAISIGDTVYVSGQGPLDPATGNIVGTTIEEQTRVTLENVKRILKAAGCTTDDCVKVTAHLLNINDFDRYNAVYREFFNTPYPARTTVQSVLWNDILVEIDAIAVCGCGRTT